MNELDHVVVGDNKTALAGHYGTALAGDYGTALAGDYSTAQAGLGGTAQAGEGGVIAILWRDDWSSVSHYKLRRARVGENSIKPNTPYKLDDEGNFVEVKPGEAEDAQ